METLTVKEKFEKAIQLMADDPDIKNIVKEIESSIPTTKGNYGRYMQFLTPFFQQGKGYALVVSKAMERVGGNSYGIQMAMNILVGC